MMHGQHVFSSLMDMDPADIASVNIDAIIRERKKKRKSG
jgi:hypothetical protein